MQTWQIMIGLQVFTTVISLIGIIVYMKQPEDRGEAK